MFDELYPEASDVALTAKLNRAPEPAPAPSFSFWSMLGAAPKGVAAGTAQGAASGADMTKAVRDKVPANVSGPFGRIPIFNAITSVMQVGADVLNPKEGQFSSEAGDLLRGVARDYTPDPQTTHAAEGAVFNLFRMGSKALTAGAMGGNIPGAVLAGTEEGFSMSADLAQQGVDVQTRTKVGAVNAAMNAAGFALPAAGKTWMQTSALALVGGPASFMAQNAATREILQSADYTKQAEQYDPFDPVGLALSTVLPLGFGALAMRGAKAKGNVPDAAPPIHPPDEVVDAARVSLVRQHMDAANPVPDNLAGADAHVKAYEQAMEQMAAGERVRVDDVAPVGPVVDAWGADLGKSLKEVMPEAAPVEVSAKPESDFVQAKSDFGLVGGHVRDGALHITTAQVDPEMQGQGQGIKLYTVLIEDALGKGLRVFSDSTVEAAAVRVYEALARRGYEVRRLEGGSLEDGAAYGKGAKEPAFEVLAKSDTTPKESPPNVQDQAPKASPDQAGTPAQGDGAAATDIPGAGGPAVQADGVSSIEIYRGLKEKYDPQTKRATYFFSTDRAVAEGYSGPNGETLTTKVPKDSVLDLTKPEHRGRLLPQMVKVLEDAGWGESAQAQAAKMLSKIDESTGNNWHLMENPEVQVAARNAGFEGMFIKEDGARNVGMFKDPIAKAPNPTSFNPAALATEASRLLSDGRSPAEVISNLEASGTKVTPELQNMLIGASEFGGRINDLVAQVDALKAQRGPNVQPFDLVAQAVDNMRNGVKVQAPDTPNPLEARLAEMTDRNPSALDAEIAVEFDANGKPTARTTLGEYLDQIKREAAQDAGDASLLEVAANCFLSGAT